MIRNCYFALGFLSYLVSKSNAGIVSFIKPCKADDNACITSSAQAALPYFVPGIPDLGIPPIDPIFIDSIKSDEANEMKLEFSNITITGVGKCKFIDFVRNTEKNIIKLVAECPLHGIGHYKADGNLRSIEVFGDGDFQISTDNVRFTIDMLLKIIEKDGHKYWEITGFDYSYDLVKKVHLDFQNLYNGDKERAKPLEQLLDIYSNELIPEVGEDLIKQLVSVFTGNIKKFFLAVPTEELELTS